MKELRCGFQMAVKRGCGLCGAGPPRSPPLPSLPHEQDQLRREPGSAARMGIKVGGGEGGERKKKRGGIIKGRDDSYP